MKLSRDYGFDGFADIVSVQDFDGSDLLANHVKDQHSLLRRERHVSVIRAVGSFRFRANIERATEVITTAASVNDPQSRHLVRKVRFTCLQKKIPKFL